jgi:hypothetical protein
VSNAYDAPFPVILGQIRKGELANELTEELARIVAGVMDVGKAGSLTLRLTIKPAAKNAHEMVVIEDELSSKAPRPDRPPTLFFATDDGGLSRKSPTQDDLPFTAVATKEI